MANFRYSYDDDEVVDDKARLFPAAPPSPTQQAHKAFIRARKSLSSSAKRYLVLIAFTLLSLGLCTSLIYTAKLSRRLADMPQERLRNAEAVYQRIKALADQQIEDGGGPERLQIRPVQTEWQLSTLSYVQDLYHDTFLCPSGQERLGHLMDGGKWICGWDELQKQEKLIVYSFGVGVPISGGSTYETELLERSNAEIWGYDFSVTSWGPSLVERPDLISRAHLKPYMIDGVTNRLNNPPIVNFHSILKENGHDWVDILKVDIEGFEYSLFSAEIAYYRARGKPLPFGQLQLEWHFFPGDAGAKYPEIHKTLHGLEEMGMRMFQSEPNQAAPDRCSEVAYVNIAHPRSPWYIKPH